MGALVNGEQRADVQEKVDHLLAAGCQIRLGGKADLQAAGAFFPPTLLFCPQPDETPAVHAIEAFGPVATLMPCRNTEHAMQLARAGGGNGRNAGYGRYPRGAAVYCRAARAHGRIQILNQNPRKNPPATVHRCRSWCTVVRDVRAAAKSWAACAR